MSPQILMLARADGSPVDTAFQPGSLGSDDPFGATRRIASAGPRGISAGIVAWSGSCEVARFPHIEMLVVHAGELEIVEGGETVRLAAGQSAVLGGEAPLRISAEKQVVFAFCAASHPATQTRSVVRLEAGASLSPSNPPPSEFLIGPVPQCRSLNGFQETSAAFRAGVWDSTPYRRQMVPHRVHELMHLIEGSMVLTDDADISVTVNRGDTVFVPHGAPCTWDSTVHVRKFYAVQTFD